ncbi:MAG TPA: hypothetical protein VFY41_08000 [Nitrososphaeraceae archaeon]|nr:hypothetical protein [Nitrososphaeraceae archaeon]
MAIVITIATIIGIMLLVAGLSLPLLIVYQQLIIIIVLLQTHVIM